MNNETGRMVDPGNPPDDGAVSNWIGKKGFGYWKRLVQTIEERYPHTFTPEWLFGGKKYGWSLRYKKGKSFCTLIPEKNRFALLIVFGKKERDIVESMRDNLVAATRNEYDRATTYHDGKWVLFTVDNTSTFNDVLQLLAIKRRLPCSITSFF